MRLLRTILCFTLAATVCIAGPAASTAQPLARVAAGAPDYRAPIDIAFPTARGTWYSNDYANPRSGGRVHRATDLFGPLGTRIYAANSGRVVWLPSSQLSNAGWAIQILGDDGRTYAYYHLGRAGRPRSTAVAKAVILGARVRRGQHIGFLGDSGNAAGGTPHLHFEIHDPRVVDPFGGTRVNPYASLRKAQGLRTVTPPPAPPPSPGPAGVATLRRGDSGPAVRRWQRQLNRVRTVDIVADGQFGPGTEVATISFQRSRGLGPAGLGVVGPKTRAAMRRALQAKPPAPAPPARKPPASAPPAQKPPVATPPATTPPLLRLGSAGPAVVRWQRQLNRAHGARLGVDGDFGPATLRATVSFQRSQGLGPAGLGVVGPKTRAAMRRALARR